MSSNKKTVICLSTGRSGTNFLKSWFDQNPNFDSFGEIYPKWQMFHSAIKKCGLEITDDRKNFSLKNLYDLEQKVHEKGKYFYYKVFYDHLVQYSQNELEEIFKNRKVIHLIRRNPLETYYSNRVAKKTEIWKLENDARNELEIIEINRKKFDIWFNKKQKQILFYSDFLRDINSTLVLYYQKNGFEEYINKNLSLFLETDFTFHAKLKKQNIFKLSEVISNYEEFIDVDKELF